MVIRVELILGPENLPVENFLNLRLGYDIITATH